MAKPRPQNPSAEQASLFDLPPAPPKDLPEGMVYRPDFVDPTEERGLLDWLESQPFKPFQFQGFEARRQVVSFGWRYDFSRSHLEKAEGPPPELVPLRDKAAALAGHAPEEMQQVLINKYEPGAPIGWHRDRAVFAEVVGVSLGAPCTFRLRRRTEAASSASRSSFSRAPPICSPARRAPNGSTRSRRSISCATPSPSATSGSAEPQDRAAGGGHGGLDRLPTPWSLERGFADRTAAIHKQRLPGDESGIL